MGEAKRRREKLRADMVEKTRGWMIPSTEFEAWLAKSILDLPFHEVPRLNPREIAWMRMTQNECHANVRWYVRNDPTDETAVATGWLMQWPEFTLHSVLERRDQYMCITPSVFADEVLHFRPDDRISWTEKADHYSPEIDGNEVPLNVRLFPSFTIARANYVLRQLETVTNPYDALDIPAQDFERMIREHVPADYWPESLAA